MALHLTNIKTLGESFEKNERVREREKYDDAYVPWNVAKH